MMSAVPTLQPKIRFVATKERKKQKKIAERHPKYAKIKLFTHHTLIAAYRPWAAQQTLKFR